MSKLVAKITDPHLLELADKMSGYRILLDDLALQFARTSRQFWQRAKEQYKLEDKKRYVLNHSVQKIEEMDTGEDD